MTKSGIIKFENYFELWLADNWDYRNEEETITIFSESSKGAINISVLSRENVGDQLEDAKNLIRYNTENFKYEISDFKIKNQIFATTSYLENDVHWIIYAVILKNRALLITYNVEKNERDFKEEELVEKMIRSIKLDC